MSSINQAPRAIITTPVAAAADAAGESLFTELPRAALGYPRGTSVEEDSLARLPLTRMPADALETIANHMSLGKRTAFALTSKEIHSAVTRSAHDPVTDAVYKAQAHFRTLREQGGKHEPLELARERVRAAVAVNAERSALQRQADRIPTLGWQDAWQALASLGQYSLALSLLKNVLFADPGNSEAPLLVADMQLALGDYDGARATLRDFAIQEPGMTGSFELDLLANAALVTGTLDQFDGDTPPVSACWVVHATVAALKARQADAQGRPADAQRWRDRVSERLALSAVHDLDGVLLWFHGMTGDTRAALDYAKVHNIFCINDPELVPYLIGPLASDENVRAEYIEFLAMRFQLPEQLATIRIPPGADIPKFLPED